MLRAGHGPRPEHCGLLIVGSSRRLCWIEAEAGPRLKLALWQFFYDASDAHVKPNNHCSSGMKLSRMTAVHPTMLWEPTDPLVALHQRFQFADPAQATAWLMQTVTDLYPLSVIAVDRLVISAANLLAWLTTTDGHYLAKCCAIASAHDRLADVAALLVWLDQCQIPVALPRPTRTGYRQVHQDHLTLGLQPVIPGQLLDPLQHDQPYAAGVVLAQVHQAMAAYPRAGDFHTASTLPQLPTIITTWIEHHRQQFGDPILAQSIRVVEQQIHRRVGLMLMSQLVHGDYRAANILWHAGTIAAVLDFEELRWGYRVSDLAWAAVHLGTRFRHWGPVAPPVHAAFIAGYEAQCPLSMVERAWLPILMVWHSVGLACAVGEPMYSTAVETVQFYTHQIEIHGDLVV